MSFATNFHRRTFVRAPGSGSNLDLVP